MTYDTQGRRVLQGHPSDALAEAKQLRAENERLRAALMRFEECFDQISEGAVSFELALMATVWASRARAALQKQEGE